MTETRVTMVQPVPMENRVSQDKKAKRAWWVLWVLKVEPEQEVTKDSKVLLV